MWVWELRVIGGFREMEENGGRELQIDGGVEYTYDVGYEQNR